MKLKTLILIASALSCAGLATAQTETGEPAPAAEQTVPVGPIIDTYQLSNIATLHAYPTNGTIAFPQFGPVGPPVAGLAPDITQPNAIGAGQAAKLARLRAGAGPRSFAFDTIVNCGGDVNIGVDDQEEGEPQFGPRRELNVIAPYVLILNGSHCDRNRNRDE